MVFMGIHYSSEMKVADTLIFQSSLTLYYALYYNLDIYENLASVTRLHW